MTRTAERCCWIALTALLLIAIYAISMYSPLGNHLISTGDSPDGKLQLKVFGPIEDRPGGVYEIRLTEVATKREIRHVRIAMAPNEIAPSNWVENWDPDQVRIVFDKQPGVAVRELVAIPLPMSTGASR